MREPDRVDAEIGDIAELGGDTRQVADAVTVAVEEAQRIDLIDDSAAPPGRFCGRRWGCSLRSDALTGFDVHQEPVENRESFNLQIAMADRTPTAQVKRKCVAK
jgi:hypothetical protein